MSTTSSTAPEDAKPPTARTPTATVIVAGIVLLVCLAIAVSFVVLQAGAVSILLGDSTGFQIFYIAVVVGLVALAALLLCVRGARGWRYTGIALSSVSLAAAAPLAVVGASMVADTKVTPIAIKGCATEYLAIEPSGGGGGSYIGARDGIRVINVQTFRGDDFGRPFVEGNYIAWLKGGHIAVSHDGASTIPAFTLRALSTDTC